MLMTAHVLMFLLSSVERRAYVTFCNDRAAPLSLVKQSR